MSLYDCGRCLEIRLMLFEVCSSSSVLWAAAAAAAAATTTTTAAATFKLEKEK